MRSIIHHGTIVQRKTMNPMAARKSRVPSITSTELLKIEPPALVCFPDGVVLAGTFAVAAMPSFWAVVQFVVPSIKTGVSA